MTDKNNKAKAWPLWASIAVTVFSVVLALLPILKLVSNSGQEAARAGRCAGGLHPGACARAAAELRRRGGVRHG